ncbi:hypothetical protein MLD38_002604 [Melastoma candidum]|uniref:Uncharacterized protein n=1 Tax=Melastoma candidum TaxID=119954 RepID=A0ACB9RZL3_9MYRT|nr:hypothetical protein MLD38_002604 [Melastoma candidum]
MTLKLLLMAITEALWRKTAMNAAQGKKTAMNPAQWEKTAMNVAPALFPGAKKATMTTMAAAATDDDNEVPPSPPFHSVKDGEAVRLKDLGRSEEKNLVIPFSCQFSSAPFRQGPDPEVDFVAE